MRVKPVRLAIALLIVLIISSVAHIQPARAQWNFLYKFPSQITCVYVVPSAPSLMFVGCNQDQLNPGALYRSSDGGASWQIVMNGVLQVTDVTFRDQSVGWISIAGNSAHPSGCYRTTNAGVTWSPVGPFTSGFHVFYNGRTGRVTFLDGIFSAMMGAWTSADDGQTWSQIPTLSFFLGSAFLTPDVGLMTSASRPSVRTTNGGTTWLQSDNIPETWQPAAASCWRELFALSETDKRLYYSKDSGQTWNATPAVPFNPTGTLRSDGNNLFAQGTSGFYVSSDAGGSWQSLPGNVSNGLDTRFCVVDGKVFLGNGGGNLYQNSSFYLPAIDYSTLLAQDIKVSTQFACVDSVIEIHLKGPDCPYVEITSADLDATPYFAFESNHFPQQLTSSGSTTIRLRLTGAKHQGTYTTNVLVHYIQHLDGQDREGTTQIKVTWTVKEELLPTLSAAPLFVKDPCVRSDSLLITNPSCDTITISSGSILGTTELSFAAGTFPLTLAPGQRVSLPLALTLTHPATIDYTARFIYRTGTSSIDTDYKRQLTVRADVRPAVTVEARYLDVGTMGLCSAKRTMIVFTNPLCLPLTIKSAQLNKNVAFSIVQPAVFPRVIASGGSDTIWLDVTPSIAGPLSDDLRLSIEVNGVKRDTSLTAKAVATSQATIQLLAGPLGLDKIDFDTVEACKEKQLQFRIVNTHCKWVKVTSMMLGGTSGLTVTPPFTLPHWMAPADTALVTVSFATSAELHLLDSLLVTAVDSSNSEATERLLIEAVSQFRTPPVTLSAASLSLDSLSPCTPTDIAITVNNATACDYQLSSLSSSDAVVTATVTPPIGSTLSPASSATIQLRIAPVAGQDGDVQVRLQGARLDTIITLHYTTKRGIPSSFSFSTGEITLAVPRCASGDTVFNVINDGCLPLDLSTLTVQGAANITARSPSSGSPGSAIPVTVTYGASNADADTSTITLSANGSLQKSLRVLITRIAPPLARIALTSLSNVAMETARAGDVRDVMLVSNDDILPDRNLTSMEADIRFEDRMLSLRDIVEQGNWKLVSNTTQGNTVTLRLENTSAVGASASEPLAKLRFQYLVGDTMKGSIGLTAVRLNPDDETYQYCTLQGVASPQTIDANLDAACGDPLISSTLKSGAILLYSLAPNPSNAQSTVSYTLATEGETSLDIFDPLGNRVYHWAGFEQIGAFQHTVPTSTLTDGTYYLRLQAGPTGAQSIVTRPLIVRR